MKTAKKGLLLQRQILNDRLSRIALTDPPPRSGWVKAVRSSLGMTIRQLADRLKVNHGAVNELEKREPKMKVTLESLERAAQAMGCKVVYAIVPLSPHRNLDDLIEERAREAAAQILQQVAHSMRLEGQGTGREAFDAELGRITEELKNSKNSHLWDITKVEQKPSRRRK